MKGGGGWSGGGGRVGRGVGWWWRGHEEYGGMEGGRGREGLIHLDLPLASMCGWLKKRFDKHTSEIHFNFCCFGFFW